MLGLGECKQDGSELSTVVRLRLLRQQGLGDVPVVPGGVKDASARGSLPRAIAQAASVGENRWRLAPGCTPACPAALQGLPESRHLALSCVVCWCFLGFIPSAVPISYTAWASSLRFRHGIW